MKRLCIGACALLLSGCFHVRLNEKTGDTQEQKTIVAMPWNDVLIADPCAATGTGLETVRYSSHYGFAWLSVITFGIVNLVNVEYSCAPQTSKKKAPLPDPDPT